MWILDILPDIIMDPSEEGSLWKSVSRNSVCEDGWFLGEELFLEDVYIQAGLSKVVDGLDLLGNISQVGVVDWVESFTLGDPLLKEG